MFNKVSVVQKVQVMMVVLVLSLIVITAVTLRGFSKVHENNLVLQEQVDPAQIKALDFKYSVLQVQQWLSDVSATRGQDGLDDGFAEAEANFKRANTLLDELVALDSVNAGFYTGEVKPALQRFYEVGVKMAQDYVDYGPSAGNRTMADFDTAAEGLAGKLDHLLEEAFAHKAKFLIQQEETADVAVAQATAVAVVAGAVLLAIMLWIVTSIRKLSILRDQALRIAERDLSGESLATNSEDEVGQLAHAIERMKKQLRESIEQISDGTQHVLASVDTMNIIAEETSEGVARQRTEIEHVATATNEMASTVHEVARNTASAASAASEAADEVSSGGAVVDDTIRAISALADNVSQASEVIANLERESVNIGTVLDVIRGIAEQTNLLALNAAIEAARAGEQGRGFAVVADEVRTLAQRTQQSTQEIQDMIERLQSGAAKAVTVMEDGRDRASDSVGHAKKAGQSLDGIKHAVTTIRDMNTQIASAAEEQSAVAEEINRNITNISAVVEQTAAGSERVAEAGAGLERLSGQLQGVVSRFRL